MDDRLQGRIALVTGASRGIGREIALELARCGADVAVNYRSDAQAADSICVRIKELGRRAVAVRANVALTGEVERMVETVRRELGPVTVLVNNAGIGTRRSLEEIDEKDWDAMLAVNLKGPFLVTQAVLADMLAAAWGRIIGLSSVAAQLGGVVGPHYAASKGGVIGLMHFYAARLAGKGITANAIAPGPIATDMAAALPELKPERQPVGRLGTVEEIASVAAMLACNGFITGQTIGVNGGLYLN